MTTTKHRSATNKGGKKLSRQACIDRASKEGLLVVVTSINEPIPMFRKAAVVMVDGQVIKNRYGDCDIVKNFGVGGMNR